MNISQIFAAGALALVLGSCGERQDNTDEITLESYAFDVISTSTDSLPTNIEGADKMRSIGEGVLPVVKGESGMQALRDSLQKLAGVQFDDKGTASPLLDPTFQATQEQPGSTEACSYSTNKLSVRLVTQRIAVWSDEAAYYPCGAAHPMYATTYVNYDRKNHRVLSLADLMKKGYEKPLAKMLREKLKDMNVDLLVSPDAVGIPETFNITRDGITFTYGLYSIAPYSSGEISVNFYAWELNDVLTSDGYSLIMGTTL